MVRLDSGEQLEANFRWVVQNDQAQNNRDVTTMASVPVRPQGEAAAASVLFAVAGSIIKSEAPSGKNAPLASGFSIMYSKSAVYCQS